MKLTVLGSGVAQPTLERGPSGYLLEQAEESEKTIKILIDCSHMAIVRLLHEGVHAQEIDAVVISHFHPDHFSGLYPFIQGRAVDDKRAKRTHRELTIIGPKTIEERLRTIQKAMDSDSLHSYPLSFHEVEGPQDLVRFGTVDITPFPVLHSPGQRALGYRFQEKEKSLVYSGDTGPALTPEMEQIAANADVLIMDAGTPKPKDSHCTPEQAIAIARRLFAKKVILTHIALHDTDAAFHVIQQQESEAVVAQDRMKVII